MKKDVEKKFKKKVLAYSLANAVSHNGQAQVGAVLPKLFKEGLEKKDIKKILPLIKEIVKKVNKMSSEKQEKELESISKLVKKRQKRGGLPSLPNVKGKVVMRFAPFPSGPLHLGNARPAILNDEYVKKYKGKLLLVIDDTIGMCTATLGYEGFLITIDIHINFLGKVKIGEKVRVKAKLVREGKTIMHFFSQISDLKGNLIATGNANLLRTRYKPDYIKAIDNYKGQDL